jgi:hypothetical protein
MTSSEALVPPTPRDEGIEPAPDGRVAQRALLILDVVFFLTMAVFAVLAPCGDWENRIFSLTIWHNGDPGGPYVISAVHFFDHGYPPFAVGHPGTTLQFLLYVAARTVHGVILLAGGATTPFIAFWARHVAWLFALSSIVVAALHIASFHALHAYARRIGLPHRTAFISVLGYATCLPVLYYGTRVSPEPLLVTLTLAALLQADSCGIALASGQRLRACLFASGAGTAAILALFTKLHLAYPLTPIVVMQVLTQHRPYGSSVVRRIREGLLPASCALTTSLAVFVVCSFKVNWPVFFDFWFQYTPGKPGGDPQQELTQRYVANLSVMAFGAAAAFAKNLGDHFKPTVNGLFTLSDGLYVVVACIGLVLLWERLPEARPRLVWPTLLCVGLFPVVAFRGVWHYYVVHLAFAAIGFAYAAEVWLTRCFRGQTHAARRELKWPVITTLLVHSASLVFFGAAKTYDVATFRSSVGPYLSALEGVPPGTRAVIVSKRFEFWQLDGGYPNYIERERVGITQAFESNAYVARRAYWVTPELVARLKISSVIDASSGIVRHVPIEQWRYVEASSAP